MLHEILLSLSGLRSPIWDNVKSGKYAETDEDGLTSNRISPAEKEMLLALSELADLHVKVRDATATISKTHPSPTCRAVGNRIKGKHLRAFTEKIIEVEASILHEDAKFVGAYKIVPLSSVVTEFQPWTRLLRWLRNLTNMLLQGTCSSAEALRYLQQEGLTGYADLQSMASDLLIAAQHSWVQCVTPWVLYGQLPLFGALDFMVQASSEDPTADYKLKSDLIPYFVTSQTADDILEIGKALTQIKSRAWSSQTTSTSGNICTNLMPGSLQHLKSLVYPLQAHEISRAAAWINESISNAALSHLLPASTILDFLEIVQDFVLLRQGEFSTTLIMQAETHMRSHNTNAAASKPVRKLGSIDTLTISEVELASILDKTWDDFTKYTIHDNMDESSHQQASKLLLLKRPSSPPPIATLLPIPVSLTISLPADSPLHIFITPADLRKYTELSSYLLSIHRAGAQLSKLWRMSAHRRCHPTPIGPPRSTTQNGQAILARRRRRDDERAKEMRSHWACASRSHFFLTEIINYMHGEVIEPSWMQLRNWLERSTTRPPSSRMTSRPTTASSHQSKARGLNDTNLPDARREPQISSTRRDDPRAIARGHRKYLDTLYDSMLLSNQKYLANLRELLVATDHFVALFQRLQTTWQALDLQQDEAIIDAFSNHARDEKDLMAELRRTNDNLKVQLHDVIMSIRDAEKERDLLSMTTGVASLGASAAGVIEFEPWRARTLDRLLMKLDSLVNEGNEDQFEDALVDVDDD